MARKYQNIKGVHEAELKLRRLKYSMAKRAVELLFYLTAAVHFDFVYKIVTGQVQEKYVLAPNSICYLLDLKWEEAGHNKLFMLTGGYAKSIQILNVATAKDALKANNITTMVIGVNDTEKLDIAETLEMGGHTDDGYIIPRRPLWKKYAREVKRVLGTGGIERGVNELERSRWAVEFGNLLRDFEKNLALDIKRRTRVDIRAKRAEEETQLKQLVERESGKDSMGAMDLLDIALKQQYKFTKGAWKNIVKKFKKYMKESRHSFPEASINAKLDKSIEEDKKLEIKTVIEPDAYEEEWEPPDFGFADDDELGL